MRGKRQFTGLLAISTLCLAAALAIPQHGCATFKSDTQTVEVDAQLILKALGDCASAQSQAALPQLLPVVSEVLTAVSSGDWNPVLAAITAAGIKDGAAIVACVRPKIDQILASPPPTAVGAVRIVVKRGK